MDTALSHSVFTTGDVAKAVGVTPGAVRLWEKAGKLVPVARTIGGFSLFSRKDVERIRRERAERG